MDRHAYLIAAHDNYYVLEQLMRLLDDPRNDIYLHVDAKARDFDPSRFGRLCRHSSATLLPRMKVYWGDYSQVESVLRMLTVALNKNANYAYLHVLSGADLPLKSADHIHQFFAEHAGDEFRPSTRHQFSPTTGSPTSIPSIDSPSRLMPSPEPRTPASLRLLSGSNEGCGSIEPAIGVSRSNTAATGTPSRLSWPSISLTTRNSSAGGFDGRSIRSSTTCRPWCGTPGSVLACSTLTTRITATCG